MISKVIINIIIIVTVLLNSTNLIMNKSYASIENNKTEYVTQSEESKFLEDIYKTETDILKIKSIDKKVSKQNYVTKQIVETKILNKAYDQYIRNYFGNTREYNDEIYKGTLELSHYNIENVDNGSYETIDEKVLEFNNYTDNDLINIDKEITIDNDTYYLINVEWEPDIVENVDGENIPVNYKGRKIYQTVKTIKNPDTYKITAVYTGTVEKKDTVYEYSILYDEKDIQEEIKEETEDKKDTNIVAPIIISGAGIIGMIAWFYKEKKDKKDNKNKKKIKTNKKSKNNVN